MVWLTDCFESICRDDISIVIIADGRDSTVSCDVYIRKCKDKGVVWLIAASDESIIYGQFNFRNRIAAKYIHSFLFRVSVGVFAGLFPDIAVEFLDRAEVVIACQWRVIPMPDDFDGGCL